MKLIQILKEIGDGQGFSYTITNQWTDEESRGVRYAFDTGKNSYIVQIQSNIYDDYIRYGWVMEVVFGVVKSGSISPDVEREVDDPKNLYRVMATVVNAAKDAKDKIEYKTDPETGEKVPTGEKVIRVVFEPTKRKIKDKSGITTADQSDNRRANLYKAYLEKEFPDSKNIHSTANNTRIWVDIK